MELVKIPGFGAGAGPGVSVFGSPVQAREFRCTGSVTKWTAATTGTLHALQVPRTAYRRNIWIAFDALRSGTVANWYLQGRLGFWMNNAKITEFPISKGYGIAPGQSMNIFAPSTGAGMQPSLRATAYETYAADYKSVDMPCFTFDVECDKITLDIDAMSLGSGNLIWTGIAIDNPGTNYQQSQLDAYSGIFWNFVYNSTNLNAGKFLSTLDGGAAVQSPIIDIKSKSFCLVANKTAGFNSTTTPGALTLAVGAGAPTGSGVTFIPQFDGLAQLMTGIIVASQYPGGL